MTVVGQTDLRGTTSLRLPSFAREVDQTFKMCDIDNNGVVDKSEVFIMVSALVANVVDPLRSYGIRVAMPPKEEVLRLFAECDTDGAPGLSRAEYEAFCTVFMRHLAASWGRQLGIRFGLGAAAGVAGLWALKRVLRQSVPLVGGLACALLPPTWFAGPLLGIAGAYVVDNGGIDAVLRLPGLQKVRGG